MNNRKPRVDADQMERPYAEEAIWRPILEFPECVGFPGAIGIHQVQLGDQAGYVDLALILPPSAGLRLVLVEAKRTANRASSADVVGQLLKYYAHALNLGPPGLKALAAAAARPRPSRLVSFRDVMGTKSLKAAGEAACETGARLQPAEIGLVVALDRTATKLKPRLELIADVLDRHHGISIGICSIESGRPAWVREPGAMRATPTPRV